MTQNAVMVCELYDVCRYGNCTFGCSDSDGEGNGNGNGGNGEGTGSSIVVGDNILSGTLTGEQTLDAKEYILNGTVIIADGGRLNIPAGTTIKAREGFSSYLLVAQGGKLYADGTADKPVIFTANTTSPVSGYWGGIIINGKAPISGSNANKSDTGLTEIDNTINMEVMSIMTTPVH